MRDSGDNVANDKRVETSDNYPAIERVLKLLRVKLSISTVIERNLSVDGTIETEENDDRLNRPNPNSTSSSVDSEYPVRRIETEGSNHHQRPEIAVKPDCCQSPVDNRLDFNPKSLVEENILSIRNRAAEILPAGRRKFFIARQLAYRSLQSLQPSWFAVILTRRSINNS